MSKISEFLDGKKTYIAVVVIFVLGGLKAVGVIDENTFQAALAIAGALGLYGLRKAL